MIKKYLNLNFKTLAAIIVAILIAAGIYLYNIANLSNTALYSHFYHTGYVIRHPSEKVSLMGPCREIEASFKVYDSTAQLSFKDRPVLAYKIRGVGKDNSLILEQQDHKLIFVYKKQDPRHPDDQEFDGLLIISSQGAILLYPSSVCLQ